MGRSTLSIVTLTKDGADTIEEAIRPLVPFADEIVVVIDSKNTDQTKEIMKRYTNKIHDDVWEDSFAVARNHAIAYAKCDWILAMDDDDILEGAEHLCAAVEEAERVRCDYIYIRYVTLDKLGKETFSYSVAKLFKNHGSWQYLGATHEYLDRKPGGDSRGLSSEITAKIRMLANPKRALRPPGRVAGRTLKILLDLYDKGDRKPRTLFYLARELRDANRVEESIKIYQEYFSASNWGDEKYVGLTDLGRMLTGLGRHAEAARWFMEAIKLDLKRKPAHVGLGECCYYLESYELAIAALEKAMSLPPSSTIMFVDRHYEEVLPLVLLSAMYGKFGEGEKGLQVTKKGLERMPDEPHLLANLTFYEDRVKLNVLNAAAGKTRAHEARIPEELLRQAEAAPHILDKKIVGKLTWQVLHGIAKYLRIRGKNQAAYEYAAAALKKIKDPTKRWMPYEEMSIVAYYTDHRDKGLYACEQVILSPHTNFQSRNSALDNVRFYISKLPTKREIKIAFDPPPGYVNANPFIMKCERGYLGIVRCVNYTILPSGEYEVNDPKRIVRTRNFLLELDEQFATKKMTELTNESSTPLYPSHVMGLEDIRLFGDRHFFCTCLELNKKSKPQTGWGIYGQTGKVTQLVPLQVNKELQIEKNWLPFVTKDGKTRFIYSIGPLRIFELSKKGKITEVINRDLTKEHIGEFRGSGSPIPYNDGWLMTVHQVHYAKPRKYFHRLVWFDRDFQTIKYGPLFFFTEPRIEYNLAICHSDEGLVVSYSVNDASAMLAIVDYKVVDEHLRYVALKDPMSGKAA